MSRTKLAVLAIDDDAGDAELLRRCLEELPDYDVQFVHAAQPESAHEELTRPGVDVIFLDYRLGAETGQDLLQALRAVGDLRPVVMLTGQGDESIAASLMRSGADDYLVKSGMDAGTLWRAIENARAQHVRRKMELRNRQLLEELQIAKRELESRNRRLADMYDTAHQFVDHVSHEFRTPLTVIREFASIMLDGLAGDLTDEQRGYLAAIVNRADDLGVLVSDMLDISRLDAGMFGINRRDNTAAGIIGHVEGTLRQRARAAQVQLEIEQDLELPVVYCDAEKIGRVIINLVINALKFSREGGRVRLAARSEPARHEVMIAVADEGPGIAPGDLQVLFGRFRQLGGSPRVATKGFGLGLSIAKELVEMNLGDITVASEQGRGSTFSFTVPCAERGPLLRRYLDRVERMRDGSRHVSLLRATSDPQADEGLLEEVGRLIQYHTRRSDLLFCGRPGEWLLVAAANREDLAPLIRRIQEAHAAANARRGDRPLPPVDLACEGCWHVGDEPAGLIGRFEERA